MLPNPSVICSHINAVSKPIINVTGFEIRTQFVQLHIVSHKNDPGVNKDGQSPSAATPLAPSPA
jgi:hypothetical protein